MGITALAKKNSTSLQRGQGVSEDLLCWKAIAAALALCGESGSVDKGYSIEISQ